MVNRAYKLCSSYEMFHKEIVFLAEYFKKNSFTSCFLYKVTNQYLKNLYQPKTAVNDVPKQKLYVSLPYIGESSSSGLRRELQRMLSKFYPSINFKFIFTNNFTILRAGVIYKYQCPRCFRGYIGSTKRLLRSRICGHMGVSYRTYLPLSSGETSAIRDHSVRFNHPVDPKIFMILDSSSCHQSLLILEPLYMKKMKTLQHRNLSRSKVVVHTLCLVWSGIVMH